MSDRFSLKLLGWFLMIGAVFCAASDSKGANTLIAMGAAAYIASFFAERKA